MNNTNNKRNTFIEIINEKCPKCGEGNPFIKQSGLLNVPEMHEDCPNCNYHFEREPGYFIGAMYVSYGIAVFLGIITFLICHFLFPSISIASKTFLVIFSMFIFSIKNFKWSRLIYLRIFP
jgi:uncharacterized protein (DUF983 family)